MQKIDQSKEIPLKKNWYNGRYTSIEIQNATQRVKKMENIEEVKKGKIFKKKTEHL